MDEVLAAIERMTADAALVARLVLANLDDLDTAVLLKKIEVPGRYLDLARVLGAAEVNDRSAWERGSAGLSMQFDYRNTRDFIQHLTGISRAEASKRIRLGDQLRMRPSMQGELLEPHRPQLAEAMLNGEVGIDSANTIVTTLKASELGSAATPENMAVAEAEMVKLAKLGEWEDVVILARSCRLALDPGGLEPSYEQIRERRGIIVKREHNGITPHIINATPPVTAMLRAIFEDHGDPKAGPRFMSDEDRERGTVVSVDDKGQTVSWVNDFRTIEQRQMDIFEGVLTAAVRAISEGAVSKGTVGQVIATISLSDLQNGTGAGKIAGIEDIIPASVIQELACDNGFYPIITDDTGYPLYHGPAKRLFTAAQRRAMIARDGDVCVGFGCHRSATTAQAHHVTPYSEGGKTNIDEGVLMCPSCHHALHSDRFELKMVDGHPWIRSNNDAWDESAWRPAAKNKLTFKLAT